MLPAPPKTNKQETANEDCWSVDLTIVASNSLRFRITIVAIGYSNFISFDHVTINLKLLYQIVENLI